MALWREPRARSVRLSGPVPRGRGVPSPANFQLGINVASSPSRCRKENFSACIRERR